MGKGTGKQGRKCVLYSTRVVTLGPFNVPQTIRNSACGPSDLREDATCTLDDKRALGGGMGTVLS